MQFDRNKIYVCTHLCAEEPVQILIKDENYSWLSEVNSMVRGESLKDLGLSIKKYHEEQMKARKTTKIINTEKFKPKFKSKKRDINSFRIIKKS